MSSKSGILYIGSTGDPDPRLFEYKHGLMEGFHQEVPRRATGLRRRVRGPGGDGCMREAAQGPDHKNEARVDSLAESRIG
jgi:hypothetical protein